MRYMATIYVSDVMESVALTVEVQEWSGQFGAPETSLRATYVWPGVGADNPKEWLGRALFLASEQMTTPAPRDGSGRCVEGALDTISETGDSRI